jgi:choline dehydrogenase-like flavoprotein
MIADVRRVRAQRLEGDVAIVGAGPAGIVLALELAAAGLDVIVLEAGGDRFARAAQEMYRAEAVSPETHGPVDMFRRRVLGGSTSVWGGRCIPFDPIDFETRPWMRHARWPIAHDDVARFYPQALTYAEAGAPEFTAGEALPHAPAPMVSGVASRDVVLDRIERFSHPTDFGRWYRQRLTDDPRIRVLLHAPVTELTTTPEGNSATGVRVALPDGASLEIAAPRVIVAAGGLETPRILLSSTRARACGLGNEHDLVGRFYQCHLEGEIGEIAFFAPARDVRIDYETSRDGVYCRRYLWLSPEAQRREQLAGLVLRPAHPNIVDPGHRHPVLSAMYLVKNWIVPEYARKMTSLEAVARAAHGGSATSFHAAHLRNLLLGSPRLAAFSADWVRRRILARRKLPSVVLGHPRNLYPIDVNAEQEPDPASRVTLGAEHDALGLRRLRIDWRTTADDHERLARGMRTIARALEPSGTVRLDVSGIDLDAVTARRVPVGGHHIGTARMADDAASGVCDANGELFGTRGVYVAGAAAFATSGFANPTLTLIALSLRLAGHIAAQAGRRAS